MNKEEQYLLFALSAPMEILNQGCGNGANLLI